MQVAYRCPNCGQFHQTDLPAESQSELVKCTACDQWLGADDRVTLHSDNGVSSLESAEFQDENMDSISQPRTSDSGELEMSNSELLGAKDSGDSFDWGSIASSTPRFRSREKSFFRKVIPPVLGGLAAFPIATAIMWYGFGRDLGNTGPWVAQFVPWIVPERIAGPRIHRTKNGGGLSMQRETESSGNHRSEFPKINAPTENSVDSRSDNSQPSVTPETASHSAQPSQSIPAEIERVDPLPPIPLQEQNELKNQTIENSTESKSVEEPSAEKSVITPSVMPSTFGDVKWKSSTDLLQCVETLRQSRAKLYTSEKSDKAELLAEYFRSICRLAELSSEEDFSKHAESRRMLDEAARELLNDKNTEGVIHFGTSGKLPNVSPSTTGDYVVAVLEVSQEDSRDLTRSWQLLQVWRCQDKGIIVESLPTAWPGSERLPTKCLVLGKLMASSPTEPESSAMKLLAHAIVPL